WCNGNVGMMGTSYAAFTAIQVAIHHPPHLKAIIPLYGTDDRYLDDVHYIGGALKALDDFAGWATMMVSMNALPPPESIGENYSKIWDEHLANNSPYQFNWLENQTDGSYWRPASLHPNFNLIECPVFIVGAWQDYYRNSALRMFEQLNVPKKLLMGPWGHVFPDWGYPGPAINFMPQVVKWFDHWLKDIDTGILEEPSFTTFMRESSGQHSSSKTSSGYWRNMYTWPHQDLYDKRFYLSSQKTLKNEIIGSGWNSYPYHVTVGMGYPSWKKPISSEGEYTKCFDDAKSLHYISDPLTERLEILGRPQLDLIFEATAPIVNVAVKLFDLAPNGSSDLISWGILNITHRESHTEPKPLTPGEQVKLKIELLATSWIFKPDHCIKLSIAGSDFPNIWPSPYQAENKVWWGEGYESCLILPVIPVGNPEDAPVFGEVEMPMNRYKIKQAPHKSRLIYNLVKDKTTLEFSEKQEGEIPEDGVEVIYSEDSVFTVSDNNPANAVLQSSHDVHVITKKHNSQALTIARLESNEATFQVNYELVVIVDDSEKFKRSWSRSFQRNLV
ncbi:MAG: CocE/NonD family hydrolase, partial [Candidatus Heimdallarchaeaceae archaeon]